MDPVGVIGLVIDVSKDLYAYYRAASDCDSDIKELRTQLLLLQHTAASLTTALNRDGLSAKDKSQVNLASTKCEDAAGELKSALERIRVDGVQPQTALEKMKAAGRKAVYPFKKSTIAGLADDVESCQDALQVAISVLQLNVGTTTIEQLVKLDDKLVASTTALESALEDLALANDTAKDEILQHLLQNRKLITKEMSERKAVSIVESLRYPQMFDRERQVSTADDSTLSGMFTGERSKHHPEIKSLLAFLEVSSGLFWVQGKPASGKSTFIKYLLSRSHGRDQLWASADPREVVFASHFCWIAESRMQKSQQGLLQSLLYQVLRADLALVPTACPFQWTSGSMFGQWHEKELWDCLCAAVAASEKQICLFIDGLDELQPERDHVPLAKALSRLSSYGNVKIVVSSRPWAAFERKLKHDGGVMTMEKNNHLAIACHIRDELEKHAMNGVFDQVSWDCIYNKWYSYSHGHDEAHELADSIATKANGVFLWVALVMEAVCRHVALGCPVSVLRSYVEQLPTELGDYFRNMIFDRIHESMISETAMALSIAMLPHSTVNLCHFALLCNYTDSGRSWLIDPNFVSNLPYTTITPKGLAEITEKTINFLGICCRDILCCREAPIREPDQWSILLACPRVTFVHRTVFDYLHTPEMQLLLDEHTPSHFKNALFETKLRIAACKMVVIDSHDSFFRIAGWEQVSLWTACLLENLDWNLPENTTTGVVHPSEVFAMVQILEDICLHHLRAAEKLLTAQEVSTLEIQDFCMTLSVTLASCGLFAFNDTLIDLAPGFVSSTRSAMSEINALTEKLSQVDDRDMVTDPGIVRRLLEAGVDPNFDFPTNHRASTPWTMFLDRIELEQLLHEHNQLQENEDWERKEYQDLRTHYAIKTFIEFGADLEPPGLVPMLESRLPKFDGTNFDWPKFLSIYSQPAKRTQLARARHKRLWRWLHARVVEHQREEFESDSETADEWSTCSDESASSSQREVLV